MQPIVIGIAGGSGSGKSTLAAAVRAASPHPVASLGFDDYYRDQRHIAFTDRERVNYDHPNALDIEPFAADLAELRAGRSIAAPIYDFAVHSRSTDVRLLDVGLDAELPQGLLRVHDQQQAAPDAHPAHGQNPHVSAPLVSRPRQYGTRGIASAPVQAAQASVVLRPGARLAPAIRPRRPVISSTVQRSRSGAAPEPGKGVAVAVSGIIGFVGLVIPHAVRVLWGARHGSLLPSAFLLGGSLLAAADAVARTAFAPLSLPVGVVTAIVGVPVFAVLVRRWAT